MPKDQKILKDYNPSDRGNLLDLRRNGAERAEALPVPEIAHNSPRRTSGGGAIYPPKKFTPFEIKLGNDGGGDYFTVGQGFIYERILSATETENSLINHQCHNRLDVGGNPTKFGINVGEAIYVIVKEDEYGRVIGGDQVLLGVDTNYKESRNYVPGGGDGITYYKLAELVADGDGVKIEPFLTGSHISRTSGLTADVVFYACPLEPEEGEEAALFGEQLVRFSFVSGCLHSLNATEEERPYSGNIVEETLPGCS